MIRLLQIEFIKLWNNRSSKILIATYFILITSIALVSMIKFDFGDIHFQLADQGIFNFPYIWHFNTFFVAWFKLFLAIVIVSMMANEYSNKTIKQNLIDGLSKKEFVLSKFLTVLVFALVSTVFIFVVSLILGLIYSDYNEVSIIFSDLEFIVAYFLKLTGFFSFCLFLGVLVKRSAFALGFLFIWQILEGITAVVVQQKIFPGNRDMSEIVLGFLPLQSMFNLIGEPITRLNVIQSAAKQLGADFKMDYHVQWYEMLIVIGWTALFIYGAYALLKRRDL
ncbi:ABC transporter permease [Aggregatimonas sangjinii]|uniref:ABC transporter permease n=1 Tax=Aggregatimonas sangjinii TaxID=2583587 RepID=A0A5B7SQD2_9FLAO|nr:ABC transporter permease [Aggregatimonas sangjinii]QCX00757.1 ABC transporter permease [Aggregatimonas sangjinii]